VIQPKRVREALDDQGRGRITHELTVTAADGTATTETVHVTIRAKAPKNHGK
jgi:VCBS repeat-containing protein